MHFLLRVAAPPWTRLWFVFHFGWLMDVLHRSIHQLKGHAQAAGGPNHYPLCRPLYVLSLNACLNRGKLSWNEAYLTNLLLLGTLNFFDQLCLVSASQQHECIFMLLQEMLQKLKMWIFLLYTYLHSPSVADEVSEEWWQLVTAIHDDVMFWYYEGDTQCNDHTHSWCICFSLAKLT